MGSVIELAVMDSDRPALVDDTFAHLVGYRWRLDKDGYVYRKVHGVRKYLHHMVMPGNRYPDYVRDHRNRDKLDNREGNLRWLTLQESVQNRDACTRNETGFRGVKRIGNRYRATMAIGGVTYRLGMYDDPAAAAAAAADARCRLMPFSPEADAIA